MTPVEVNRGDAPVILGLPHTGTWLPPEVEAALNDTGRALADTDWHVDALYAGLLPVATTVRATFHRYLIDANRGADDASLYPGRNTTGLVPATDFDGRPIWRVSPTPAEIADRLARFHAPYHAALRAEVERIRALQGVEFRAPLTTSPALQATIARLRATVPPLGEDRYLAPDLEAAATLVRDGALLDASGAAFPDLAP
jgi:N-formylglutamate amidohydrolase